MDASTSLLLIVVSRRDQIEAVHEPLDRLMQRLGLDDERRWRVDLAVREALANAIVHGNREDPTTMVRVSAEGSSGELVIRIEDEGDGFDPVALADPRRGERRPAPGGRGVFLMRELVRAVSFERGPRGTVVTLRERLGSRAG